MGEELQSYLDKLLLRIDGLKAITITDQDGVILIKSVSNDVPPRMLEPAISTTFAAVSEQVYFLYKLIIVADHNEIVLK
ncbi:hypothetical protein C2G38_1456410 [Gigaspora rosea]|uniref:Roadblock/LAMTOR2 domain-containing protein n=1 Tax=Gigaspora rosea TaxID=44941 RepID=A0A397V6Z2_9GLOM|nr:hypothetical protein C2G38_1456410 [Gigaspora rosea]